MHPRRNTAQDKVAMDAMLFTLALLGAGVTYYTHMRLADYVLGARQTAGLRLFLVLLGIGVGIMAVKMIAQPAPVLSFIAGFGIVHLPPALVLMLKHLRGEGRS